MARVIIRLILQMNFTNAMNDANYAAIGTSKDTTGTIGSVAIVSQATGSIRIVTVFSSKYDPSIVNIVIFGS